MITTSFLAEKALSRDTVPVNVDAVLFWHVWDAQKATLEVSDYKTAVSWAAQTALRDMIGRTMLASLLSEREELDVQLRETIDAKTEPWGITVQSVEIRDVVIPETGAVEKDVTLLELFVVGKAIFVYFSWDSEQGRVRTNRILKSIP